MIDNFFRLYNCNEGVRRREQAEGAAAHNQRIRVPLQPTRIKMIPNSNIQVNHLFTEGEA